MTFTGITWYVRYFGTQDVVQELLELMEEIQAEKQQLWRVDITKYSNQSNTQFAVDQIHQLFHVKDSKQQEGNLVQIYPNKNHLTGQEVWGFVGKAQNLSKSLGMRKDTALSVKGHSFSFGDFTIEFGQIFQEEKATRDNLIKLEFKAINKFASGFTNYQQIGYDFFYNLSPELCETIDALRSFDASAEYLKTISSSFECLNRQKYLLDQPQSVLLLLHKLNLISSPESPTS